jgi:hypothetical protein
VPIIIANGESIVAVILSLLGLLVVSVGQMIVGTVLSRRD